MPTDLSNVLATILKRRNQYVLQRPKALSVSRPNPQALALPEIELSPFEQAMEDYYYSKPRTKSGPDPRKPWTPKGGWGNVEVTEI